MPADKNTASINLVMTNFVANSATPPASGPPGGSYCPVTSVGFALSGGNPDNADGQVTIAGTTISVKRNKPGNYPIVITINVSCPDGVSYNPQAMVFVQTGGGVGDGNGNQNFTDRTPSNQSITIKDQIKHKGAGASWKFYIQVKQAATGGLGWIDPDILNEN